MSAACFVTGHIDQGNAYYILKLSLPPPPGRALA